MTLPEHTRIIHLSGTGARDPTKIGVVSNIKALKLKGYALRSIDGTGDVPTQTFLIASFGNDDLKDLQFTVAGDSSHSSSGIPLMLRTGQGLNCEYMFDNAIPFAASVNGSGEIGPSVSVKFLTDGGDEAIISGWSLWLEAEILPASHQSYNTSSRYSIS